PDKSLVLFSFLTSFVPHSGGTSIVFGQVFSFEAPAFSARFCFEALRRVPTEGTESQEDADTANGAITGDTNELVHRLMRIKDEKICPQITQKSAVNNLCPHLWGYLSHPHRHLAPSAVNRD
ncbi:MAG: hypothetical protein LBG27_07230, partial [Spirochaetaceae bacterium]|nr:hypothetical protein [Spirochaetaceae bacterium]